MASDPKPLLSKDLDALAAQFYAHCAEGRLHFQRCTTCGAWRHLPRHACAACGSPEWEWSPSTGRGRVFSWTVTHQAPWPGLPTPYVVAVIEMEEGVRLAAGLRGVAPEQLCLDLPVEVELVRVSDDAAVPFFRAVE
ncbi:MAG: hypothetical protein DCC71_06535 [Proteobacteria bacterium]|nr:MAG: hypothetical protein DCC71_06535 [Pseudomonadota bacterium]